MPRRLRGGRPFRGAPYGPAMNTNNPTAPRSATIHPTSLERARGPIRRRPGIAGVAAGAVLALALGACSPNAAATPLPINSLLPGVNPSAVASAAASAALAALDQVDTAIAANTSSTGLTADDASSLTQLTAGARTALQTGDTSAAKTAVDNLATKVTGLASKLNGPAGQQLTTAIAALKAAMPAS